MAFSTPLLLFCSLSSLSVLTSFLPPQLMPCPLFLQSPSSNHTNPAIPFPSASHSHV